MRLKSGTKPRSISGITVPVIVPVRPQMKITTFLGLKPPGWQAEALLEIG